MVAEPPGAARHDGQPARRNTDRPGSAPRSARNAIGCGPHSTTTRAGVTTSTALRADDRPRRRWSFSSLARLRTARPRADQAPWVARQATDGDPITSVRRTYGTERPVILYRRATTGRTESPRRRGGDFARSGLRSPPSGSRRDGGVGCRHGLLQFRTPLAGALQLPVAERPIAAFHHEFGGLGDRCVSGAPQSPLDVAGRASRRPPDPCLERGRAAVARWQTPKPGSHRRMREIGRRGRLAGRTGHAVSHLVRGEAEADHGSTNHDEIGIRERGGRSLVSGECACLRARGLP